MSIEGNNDMNNDVIVSNIELPTPGNNDNDIEGPGNNEDIEPGMINDDSKDDDGLYHNDGGSGVEIDVSEGQSLKFSDEDTDDWGDDDGFISASDDQQVIQPSELRKKGNQEPEGEDEIKQSNPNQHKCWQCQCGTINSLLKALICVQCELPYRIGTKLFYSEDYVLQKLNPDIVVVDENGAVYEAWECRQCHVHNDINNKECYLCSDNKPVPIANWIRYTSIKPKTKPESPKYNDWNKQNDAGNNNDWGNADLKQKKQNYDNWGENHWSKNKNAKLFNDDSDDDILDTNLQKFGKVSSIKNYLDETSFKKCNDRLINLFGYPYRNKYMTDNPVKPTQMDYMTSDVSLSWNNVPLRAEPIKIAFNVCNGNLAEVDEKTDLMKIYVSKGLDWEEKIVCKLNEFNVTDQTVIKYYKDKVYLYNKHSSRIHWYLVDLESNNNSCIYGGSLEDEYMSQVKAIDMDFVDDLLIILFNKWVGIYQINLNKAELNWMHAVSFAKSVVKSKSFKVMNDDATFTSIDKSLHKKNNKYYLYVLANHNIVSIHPVNPNFEIVHVAQGKVTDYAISRKHGTYWVVRNDIYQSYDNQSRNAVLIHSGKDIDNSKITRVFYQEMYGISGRLLIFHENGIIKQKWNKSEIQWILNRIYSWLFFNDINDKRKCRTWCIVLAYAYGYDIIFELLIDAQYKMILDKCLNSFESSKSIKDSIRKYNIIEFQDFNFENFNLVKLKLYLDSISSNKKKNPESNIVNDNPNEMDNKNDINIENNIKNNGDINVNNGNISQHFMSKNVKILLKQQNYNEILIDIALNIYESNYGTHYYDIKKLNAFLDYLSKDNLNEYEISQILMDMIKYDFDQNDLNIIAAIESLNVTKNIRGFITKINDDCIHTQQQKKWIKLWFNPK